MPMKINEFLVLKEIVPSAYYHHHYTEHVFFVGSGLVFAILVVLYKNTNINQPTMFPSSLTAAQLKHDHIMRQTKHHQVS